MKYYCEDSQQVLQELNSQKSGLTEKEAAERLLQNGANELKAAKGKSPAAPVCGTGGRSDDRDPAGGSGHQRCACSPGK